MTMVNDKLYPEEVEELLDQITLISRMYREDIVSKDDDVSPAGLGCFFGEIGDDYSDVIQKHPSNPLIVNVLLEEANLATDDFNKKVFFRTMLCVREIVTNPDIKVIDMTERVDEFDKSNDIKL